MSGGATLALIGDLKQMSPKFLQGVSLTGYGTSLMVGAGIPIPILNEEILDWVSISDDELYAPVVDYSYDYPNSTGKTLGSVSYGELRSGKINFMGKEIPTGSLSSYKTAREIAGILKQWIKDGKFLLTAPVFHFPGPDSKYQFKPLKEE